MKSLLHFCRWTQSRCSSCLLGDSTGPAAPVYPLVLPLEPGHLPPEAGHCLQQRVQLIGGAQGLEAGLSQLRILPEQLGLESPHCPYHTHPA